VIESIELREMAMNGSAHADESSAVPVTIEAGPQSTLA
jgi:hypothetical protein